MQKVSSIIRREGEESMKRGILDRYQHSKDKDVRKMGLRSHYHLAKSHHGNKVSKIWHEILRSKMGLKTKKVLSKSTLKEPITF